MASKDGVKMANIVKPDQNGQQCLLKTDCPKSKFYYGIVLVVSDNYTGLIYFMRSVQKLSGKVQ